MSVARVRKLALRIAKTTAKPDIMVVELAALFHDMAGKDVLEGLMVR